MENARSKHGENKEQQQRGNTATHKGEQGTNAEETRMTMRRQCENIEKHEENKEQTRRGGTRKRKQ